MFDAIDAIIGLGVIFSAIFCTGAVYAYFRHEYRSSATVRGDLGVAIVLGLLLSLFSWAGAFFTFLMTGFCEYGWGPWNK